MQVSDLGGYKNPPKYPNYYPMKLNTYYKNVVCEQKDFMNEIMIKHAVIIISKDNKTTLRLEYLFLYLKVPHYHPSIIMTTYAKRHTRKWVKG